MKQSRMDAWINKVEEKPIRTRKELEELQLEKLNILLKREKERNGFYQLPDSISSLNELSSLPFTTSQDILQYASGIVLGSSSQIQKIITDTTSGTTGLQKRIFYTQRDLEHTIGLFEVGIGEMVSKDEVVLNGMPNTGPDSLGDLIDRAISNLNATSKSIQFGTIFQQCEQIYEMRPDCIICLPTWLLSVVRCYEWRYQEPFPAKRALLSADAIPETVVRELEKRDFSLYPHYGSREMCFAGAVTCPAHKGMHLRENHVIAEIIDEKGNPLPDGSWGELVITTIDMELFPLIRYRTGDRARFLSDDCVCGGLTRRLDSVHRMDEKSLLMEQLDDLLFAMDDIVDLKVTEDEDLLFDLLVIKKVDIEKIQRLLKDESLMKNIQIHQKVIDEKDLFYYLGKRIVNKV